MKSKEVIELLAKKCADKSFNKGNGIELHKVTERGYILGYTQCQEDNSIGFAEWIAKKNIKPSCSEGMWLIIKNYDDIERRLNSKELYKIYIQSLNKQDNE